MKAKHPFILLSLLAPFYCLAWGAEGHKMVAEIAKQELKPGIETLVQQYLDTTSFEQAAVWMDEVRSNHSYDYMKTWHYVNIEKGGVYAENPQGDVVSELNKVIAELKNYKLLQKEAIKTDLLILFHLCGDIAQPLHAGYGSDKGGNDIKLTLNGKNTNLHHIWDTDIIVNDSITVPGCMKMIKGWKKGKINSIRKIDVMAWMNDSRALLPNIYDYTDTAISQTYLDSKKTLVEQQLAKGGLRLAAVLNMIFGGK